MSDEFAHDRNTKEKGNCNPNVPEKGCDAYTTRKDLDMKRIPDPNAVFPNEYKTSCFIKNVITAPNISVGDYTYYDDTVDPAGFEKNNVLFNYPEFGDHLVIGKFCQIASGTKFIMGRQITVSAVRQLIRSMCLAGYGRRIHRPTWNSFHARVIPLLGTMCGSDGRASSCPA